MDGSKITNGHILLLGRYIKQSREVRTALAATYKADWAAMLPSSLSKYFASKIDVEEELVHLKYIICCFKALCFCSNF